LDSHVGGGMSTASSIMNDSRILDSFAGAIVAFFFIGESHDVESELLSTDSARISWGIESLKSCQWISLGFPLALVMVTICPLRACQGLTGLAGQWASTASGLRLGCFPREIGLFPAKGDSTFGISDSGSFHS
jgi:hypothetical protein